jgi:hypothetical protein
MVHLPSLQAMQNYWNIHKHSLLKEHSEGYIVLTYSPERHMHFQTLQEVYRSFPVLERVSTGEPIFGTLPILIDITEEFWKERESSKQSRDFWKEFENSFEIK